MKKIINIILKYLYLLFLGAVVFGSLWLRNYFGNVTLDEVIFQATTPLEGININVIYNCIFSLVIPAIISSLIVYILIFYKPKKENKIYPLKKKYKIIIYIVLSIICLGFGLYKTGILSFVKDELTKSSFIEDNYVDPRETSISFPQKKNLILIFLESMEASYADKESGGIIEDNLIPNLTRIALDNISFSNKDGLGGARYTYGATWTSGAMSTQLSGVPYKINLKEDNIFGRTMFLPGLYNMGDLLKDNGYTNELMIGSKAIFGGRDLLFGTHGYDKIYDWSYMIDNGIKKEDDHNDWWGLEDSDLFTLAKDELKELASKNTPFNLTMLTVDTHFEDGYLSSKCDNKYDDHYKNVIYCNDGLVSEFIDWIKEQDFYENTTIVLVGDHLTMDVDFFDDYDKNYVRTVYNAFINSSVNTDNIKNRTFMSFDLFPTILSSMGATYYGDRLGLGTDLFSDSKTLAEEYGYDYVINELKYRSIFYDKNFVEKKRD